MVTLNYTRGCMFYHNTPIKITNQVFTQSTHYMQTKFFYIIHHNIHTKIIKILFIVNFEMCYKCVFLSFNMSMKSYIYKVTTWWLIFSKTPHFYPGITCFVFFFQHPYHNWDHKETTKIFKKE